MKRRTLRRDAEVSGAGLHTGKEVRLTIRPAAAGAGVSFARTDLPGRPAVPARTAFVAGADRGTTLKKGDAVVHTVEHVLSALMGLGIDDASLELTGPEVPEPDGSALPFVAAIRAAGIEELPVERQVLRPPAPLLLAEGPGRFAAAAPADSLQASYTLSYAGPPALVQHVAFSVDEATYEREIAPARTFCLASEVEGLRAAGLIRGGSLSNAVVLEADGRTSTPLRFPDEPARHKLLDLLGDLFLAGGPLAASVAGCRTGHATNQRLATALAASRANGRGEPRFPSNDPAVIAAAVSALPIETDAILQILPHRYPFLLVDRIVEFEPGARAVGIKEVRADEEVFEGHFPGEPILPGVLILEALAQVGGVLVLSRPENLGRLAFFAAIKDAKFRRPVRPGDTLRLEVENLRLRGRLGMASGRAKVGDDVCAEAEIWFGFGERTGKDSPR